MPDPIPADLARALAAASPRLGPFGRVEYFAEVGSTNDLALDRALRGAPHGTVGTGRRPARRTRADRAARGFRRPAPGSISLPIVRREAWDGALSLVTLAAGVAVARGLSAATGLAFELKWPNDVVIGRPWRKVAGILSESASIGSRIDAVVVGIGVNVRPSAFPLELADRATAIEMETDRPVDAPACVVEVLAALADVTSSLGRRDRAAIVEAWRQYGRAGLGGEAVRWNDEHGVRRGVARDVDEAGALVVEADGQVERLVAGEVLWDRLSRD